MKQNNMNLLLLCLVFGALNLYASDLVEFLPLTDSILMVHFDDGHVVYHKVGQARDNEQVVVDPLDTAAASKAVSYSITSTDDAAYATAKNPLKIGRKTKGTEWSTKGDRSNNHAKEHWVYLFLPSALQAGKTYTVATGSLAKNKTSATLTFDAKKVRSEAVHVNLVGYSTAAPEKYAYLYHWMGSQGSCNMAGFAGKKFQVVDTTTNVSAFEGTIAFRQNKNHADFAYTAESKDGNLLYADVWDCDFSAFNTPGNYRIVVDGIGCSFPFSIGADIYRDVFRTVMKGFYYNRSGIALEKPYTDYVRPADHHPTLSPGFSGHLWYSSTRISDAAAEGDKAAWDAGLKGPIDTWGWYHDAGDWDGYISHIRVPINLLFTYDLFPEKFNDGDLAIPENKNGIPDILDEASWLLRYLQRTRKAVKDKGWGTGGVAGMRVMPDNWGGEYGTAPGTYGSWQDIYDKWVVSGECPYSSYLYAGMAAQLAYLLKTIGKTDPQGVDWQKEAEEAYAWAGTNATPGKLTDWDVSMPLAGCRMYGAAALYRLTGTASYQTQFISDLAVADKEDFTNKGVTKYGVWLFATIEGTGITADQATLTECYDLVKTTADFIMLYPAVTTRACRWAGNWWMPLVVGEATTPLIEDGVIGYGIVKKKDPAQATKYLARMFTTADYFLGCNPLNQAWVTGLAERHPTQIMHLDWWYSGIDEILPGIIPYGPFEKANDFVWFGVYSHISCFYSIYPLGAINWPAHERWFNSRYAVATGEFTIHQTNAPAAMVYGALCSSPGTSVRQPQGKSAIGLQDTRKPGMTVREHNGTFSIELAAYDGRSRSVRLSDAAGRLVKEYRIDGTGKQTLLATPSLGKGVYFLTLSGAPHGKALRLMVK
jgi:endoglucanase